MLKLFISYSTGDLELVREIADHFSHRAEVLYWEEISEPGKDAWQTIFNAIDRSDLVIAIITDGAVARAMSVGQEIGRAVAKGKPVIPLVGQGVRGEDLGCLNRITYVRIDPENQVEMVVRIHNALSTREDEISKRKREAWIAAAVIIAGLLILPQED